MVGIIILNYMSYNETVNCVTSIRRTTKSNFKIYIVDNFSPNESYEYLQKKYENSDDINISQTKSNKGYSAGNNFGISKALEDGCEFICISNSDIIFHNDAIDIMSDFLLKNKDVGIVGPKIYDKNGHIQKRSYMLTKTGIKEKIFARTRLRRFNLFNTYIDYFGSEEDYYITHPVYAVHGSCFMMSKNMTNIITPFDENTFLYEEEMIIGIRANNTNMLTYYLDNAEVTHFHARSSKHIGAYSLIHLVNSEIYYCKTYLNKSLISILPLYMIRLLHYLSLCIKDKNYRDKFFTFFIQSQKRLWSKKGLIKTKED